jgi:hypothetical protein
MVPPMGSVLSFCNMIPLALADRKPAGGNAQRQ